MQFRLLLKHNEKYIVAFILLLFTVRLSFPYLNYLLFPILVISFVYILYSTLFKIGFKKTLKEYTDNFWPLLITILILVFEFLFTSDKSSYLVKEVLHSCTVFIILYLIIISTRSYDDFKNLLTIYIKLIIVVSAFVGILGLVKFIYSLYGVQFDFLRFNDQYSIGTSIVADVNFYNILFFICSIFILRELSIHQSAVRRIGYQVILVVINLNIILSTSRRGLIIFVVLFISVILVWVISISKRNKSVRTFIKNTVIYVTSILMSILLILYYVFFVPTVKKNEYLALSSLDNNAVQYFINNLLFESRTIVDEKVDYYQLNNDLWKSSFDSRYPHSGWGIGNYDLIPRLTGKNVEIVPDDAQGYKLDKRAECTLVNNSACFYSRLQGIRVRPGYRYIASVYCFVSEDFNGNSVKIYATGGLNGLTRSSYDLSEKGGWQKMVTSFYGDSTESSVYINFLKTDAADFNELTGYVVFAYPEIEEIKYNPKKPKSWASNNYTEVFPLTTDNSYSFPDSTIGCKYFTDEMEMVKENKYHFSSEIFEFPIHKEQRAITTIFTYVSEEYDGNRVGIATSGNIYNSRTSHYNLQHKGTWQKLTISNFGDSGKATLSLFFSKENAIKPPNNKGYVIFAYPNLLFDSFRSKDAKTWANSSFDNLISLSDNIPGIIPANTTGLKIDKSFPAYKGKGFSYIGARIQSYYPNPNIRTIASVYAYVSPDFNGNRVIIKSTGNLKGTGAFQYDLTNKGTWQKLFTNCYGTAGLNFIELQVQLDELMDQKFDGYVVFSYPQVVHLKFDPLKPVTYAQKTFIKEFPLKGKNVEIVPPNAAGYRLDKSSSFSPWKDIVHSTTVFSDVDTKNGQKIKASVYCYVSEDFNGNSVKLELRGDVIGKRIAGYILKNKGTWQKLELEVESKEGDVKAILFFSQKGVKDFTHLKGHVIFACPKLELIKESKDISNNNHYITKHKPYRIIKAGLFPEWFLSKDTLEVISDSTKSFADEVSFEKEYSDSKFSGTRLDRWRYAIFLYKNEYSWWQKIVGGGFGYTVRFNKTFSEGVVGYDYPHNPFLSVLLYSGLIGLVAYLWLLCKVVYYYWKYRREYWHFFLCFIIIFFFSLFSANDPFDPSVMGLFMIFPFIFEFINRQDRFAGKKTIYPESEN